MGLFDWDWKESICSLEHNPLCMLFDFFFDRRSQIFHAPYVYSNPASILVVIHAEEPRHQGFNWVHIRVVVALPISMDEGQAQELKVQHKKWNIGLRLIKSCFQVSFASSVPGLPVDKNASSWSFQCCMASWPRYGITLFQFFFVEKFYQLPLDWAALVSFGPFAVFAMSATSDTVVELSGSAWHCFVSGAGSLIASMGCPMCWTLEQTNPCAMEKKTCGRVCWRHCGPDY